MQVSTQRASRVALNRGLYMFGGEHNLRNHMSISNLQSEVALLTILNISSVYHLIYKLKSSIDAVRCQEKRNQMTPRQHEMTIKE